MGRRGGLGAGGTRLRLSCCDEWLASAVLSLAAIFCPRPLVSNYDKYCRADMHLAMGQGREVASGTPSARPLPNGSSVYRHGNAGNPDENGEGASRRHIVSLIFQFLIYSSFFTCKTRW